MNGKEFLENKLKEGKKIGSVNKEKLIRLLDELPREENIIISREDVDALDELGILPGTTQELMETLYYNNYEDIIVYQAKSDTIKRVYDGSCAPARTLKRLGILIMGTYTSLKELEEVVSKAKVKLKEVSELREIDLQNNISELDNGIGVYGIFIDDKLVYIGKTAKSFKERWKTHIKSANNYVKGEWQQEYLYKAMRDSDDIRFEKLVVADEFTNHEIECMEYALITTLKPKFNYQGIKVPYQFTRR